MWHHFGLILIDKNPFWLFDEYVYSEKLKRIKDFFLLEFKNTVFDNGYMLETIKQINDTGENIITRYGAFFDNNISDNEGDETVHTIGNDYTANSVYYLLKRLENYYDDGFYFYNNKRLIFLDLKRRQVIKYIFDRDLSELSKLSSCSHIYLSDDMKIIYMELYDKYDIHWYKYDMYDKK
jgi:hypothetical protein